MTGFKLDRFLGLIPRVPDSLLPPSNASKASNCDFAYGELRNTKTDSFYRILANKPASIYTDDGVTFYSWTEDVNAVRSPLANDTHNRLYYTTPTDFRVTERTGELSTMTAFGGPPKASYRTGVPRPATAPVLTDKSVLEGATVSATFHYEHRGVKYQEEDIVLSVVKPLETWTFTPPSLNYTEPTFDPETRTNSKPIPRETPPQAIPVVRIRAKATDNTSVLDLYTANSLLGNGTGLYVLSMTKTGDAGDYTLTLALKDEERNKVTRAYVFTLVNIYGEESAPSNVATISLHAMRHATVGIKREKFSDYAPIEKIRVYRTADGGTGDEYFLTLDMKVPNYASGPPDDKDNKLASYQFTDETDASALSDPLPTQDTYPPDPLLVGLLGLPNGILMAWKGNELHFSEAYKPWSWPPAYVMTFGDCNIVSAIAFGSGALVTTTGKPFLLSGVSPDAMTDSKINLQQAGVSKWAIADVGGMVVYASHDGLNAIVGGQSQPDFGGRYFTRQVWRERYAAGLDTMRFAVWDGRLVVYSSSAGTFVPFMISLDEADGAMTELPDLKANCSFTSPLADQCYLCVDNQLLKFADGVDAKASWMSREAVLPSPVNFGVAQVVCRGNWTLKLYADNMLYYSKDELNGNVVFRLPSGYRSDRWKVSLEGTGQFRELRIAVSPRDLGAF